MYSSIHSQVGIKQRAHVCQPLDTITYILLQVRKSGTWRAEWKNDVRSKMTNFQLRALKSECDG